MLLSDTVDFRIDPQRIDRHIAPAGHQRAIRLLPGGRVPVWLQIMLMVADIVMPGMDGYELYRRLQADPLKRRIPVIILTGLDGVQRHFRIFGKAYPNIVTKPFSPYNLLDKVDEVFKAMGKPH